MSNPPKLLLLIVLVIEIRNTPDWPAGIPAQERQIKCQTDAALAESDVSKARSKVYWISVIGPHWWYGLGTVSRMMMSRT